MSGPETVCVAGPCRVTQYTHVELDGYNSLTRGFGEKKEKRTNNPLKWHLANSGAATVRVLKEVAVENPQEFSPGQKVTVEMFAVGERVEVTGTTKGRGFSGVIKRHGFHGGKKTHGSHSHRIPGSIGCSAGPAKVIKGKKMPGHYGHERKTVRNLEIFDIRPKENLILLKGAVPGHTSGFVTIRKPKFAK